MGTDIAEKRCQSIKMLEKLRKSIGSFFPGFDENPMRGADSDLGSNPMENCKVVHHVVDLHQREPPRINDTFIFFFQ